MACILEIRDLHVAYRSPTGDLRPALDGIGFSVAPREILGLLGESGSGKSTIAASLLRLLPPNGCITKGSVIFEGQDLLWLDPHELAGIRGRRISLISQEPAVALHPTMRVCHQLGEVLRAHEPLDRATRRERVRQALELVFASDAERIYFSYPHQLSGGQRQRVLIAQAIVCAPSLIIADEPTASLDPTTQREILSLFRRLREQLGLALVLITHNPALQAGLADRVLVLYAGQVAELGPAEAVLFSPRHPYTQALLRCMPLWKETGEASQGTKLPVISGDSPSLLSAGPACRFEPRCTERMGICAQQDPTAVALSEAHTVSCFKYGH